MSSFTVIKVAFGKDAHHGDFPHQVSLYSYTKGHFCGASIIHPFLIVGAAHCFETPAQLPPNILVRAGLHRQQWMYRDSAEQIRNVSHVFVHKNWNSKTWDNDIAVLVLNQSLEFNDHVRPITLRGPDWELPGANSLKIHAYLEGFPAKYQNF